MWLIIFILTFLLPSVSAAFPAEDNIAVYQQVVRPWPVGDRIAFWAEQFLDTPYDPDPLGCYVRNNSLVSDEKVDCMYLVFRVVELALAEDPSGTIDVALDKRFRSKGMLAEGKVMNYADRFEYGEDMIESGKWGREITPELGRTKSIKGSRGKDRVLFVSGKTAIRHIDSFCNGDIIFFVQNPSKRIADEIIGHIGIVKKEQDGVFLVHAAGLKNKGGTVRKVLLSDYLTKMPFIGVRATRFEAETLMP